jgi:hypothetical protein
LQKNLDEIVTADEQVTRCVRKVLCAPLSRFYGLANGGGAACPVIAPLKALGWQSENIL